MTSLAVWAPQEVDTLGPMVPERWCETTLIPWADSETNFNSLEDAHAKMSAVEAAYQKLGREVLELTKARRYLELRLGEMLLDHMNDQKRPRLSVPSTEDICRKFARNKQVVVDMIEAATDADTISRAAVMRAVKQSDPKYRKDRQYENKRRQQQRENLRKQVSRAEAVLDRETQRRAAKRRGDHIGKSWSLIENLLVEVDLAVSDAPWGSEQEDLLTAARMALHDAWDLLGQAVRLS